MKTEIQSLAEFLGWGRNKAEIVKQTNTDIAPNGTRRERRINSNFVPSGDEGSCSFYLNKVDTTTKRVKKLNKQNMKLGGKE